MSRALNLSEYVLEPLRKDGEFVLYRATHSRERITPSALVLAPASESPSPATLKKIEHEYSLRHELDSAWAVRPQSLSEHRGQTVLTLEDPGGETLEKSLWRPMETGEFLRCAIGLATALGGLHGRRLIHKDVKPANVLINPATGQTRLLGFGIASRLPRERQAPQPPETIAGTLAYMAPEQTGRMNRAIDARSDLYRSGRHLLRDAHAARCRSRAAIRWSGCTATSPGSRYRPASGCSGIPMRYRPIVMKLLAKTAEERYQTAAGLRGGSASVPRRVGGRAPHRAVRARRIGRADRLADPGDAVRSRGRGRGPRRRVRPGGRRRGRPSSCWSPAIRASANPPWSTSFTGCSSRRADSSPPASSISTSATSRTPRLRRRSGSSCARSSARATPRSPRGARRSSRRLARTAS